MTSLRDLKNNIGAAETLRPQVATDAVTGQTVDTRGFDSACFHIQTGAVAGAGDFGVAFQESDNGSDWGAVDADELDGSVPATLVANSVYRVGYLGHKRYVRANATKAGGTSLALSASVLLGNPNQKPVA